MNLLLFFQLLMKTPDSRKFIIVKYTDTHFFTHRQQQVGTVPVYSTFPGFIVPQGSKAALMRRIISSSTGSL